MPEPRPEIAAIQAAADALAPLLPSENGLIPGGPPAVLSDLTPALPGAGARMLTCGLGGLDGATLLVALAGELADVLEQGPRGVLDLGDVLRPAINAALVAMAPSFGALTAEGITVLAAGARPPVGDALAASLFDGDRLAVTVALVAPAGSFADEADPDPEPIPAAAASATPAPVATPVAFDSLADGAPTNGSSRSLDLLHDVEMGVTAELGRTRLTVRNLLALVPGSVVELDRAAGTQVDLLVNGTLIARGEVVVIDDEFGVRISEVVGGANGEGRH